MLVETILSPGDNPFLLSNIQHFFNIEQLAKCEEIAVATTQFLAGNTAPFSRPLLVARIKARLLIMELMFIKREKESQHFLR